MSITVRNLRDGEALPQGLHTGFEELQVMPLWCWIAEQDSEVLGVLMGAPCHGLVYLLRLCVKPECKTKIVPLLLLRAFLRDCFARGFKAYFTHLDPTRELEGRLLGLCREAQGVQVTVPQVAVVGFLHDAGRY
jgi:hypothetical protein